MKDALKEIKDKWYTEAKSEDNNRYFYHTEESSKIANGTKCYVISRKGTGKTALCQHILSSQKYNRHSTKLSFKNFPFNDVYKHSDSSFRKPNQYITFWKYVIYNKICEMMARNEKIDANTISILRKVYEIDPTVRLAKQISRWTANEFGVKIFDIGCYIKGRFSKQNDTLAERVDTLEQLISSYIDDSSYYIAFDELDEDYRNVFDSSSHSEYISLLTGLFKAVQDVRSIFATNDYKIYPIIFLRNDIYELIKDSDKAKWDDLKISIDWDIPKLKDLLAFRIERAFDNNSNTHSFEQAWNKIFTNQLMPVGNQSAKRLHTFDYMLRSTHMRPRDFIKYFSACAESTQENSKINISSVKDADKNFLIT